MHISYRVTLALHIALRARCRTAVPLILEVVVVTAPALVSKLGGHVGCSVSPTVGYAHLPKYTMRMYNDQDEGMSAETEGYKEFIKVNSGIDMTRTRRKQSPLEGRSI